MAIRTLLVPAVVTAAVIAAAISLAPGSMTLLVGYLLAVLVIGPWTTGFVAARSLDSAPQIRTVHAIVSLLATTLVVAGLVCVLGLGVLVGAGFATAIGAGAGMGIGPWAAIRAGWNAASDHMLAAAITLASWFGALASLAIADSMDGALETSAGPLAFVSIVASVVVVAANRRWALAAAKAQFVAAGHNA